MFTCIRNWFRRLSLNKLSAEGKVISLLFQDIHMDAHFIRNLTGKKSAAYIIWHLRDMGWNIESVRDNKGSSHKVLFYKLK